MFRIGDLSGGGGAERFFADIVRYYAGQGNQPVSPVLVLDQNTHQQLLALGRITGKEHIRFVSNNRFQRLLELIRIAGDLKPDIIHIPLIAPQYLLFLVYIAIVRRNRRPAITMTQVDCSVAYTFSSQQKASTSEQKKSLLLHRIYFSLIPLDGIYTWYESFARLCPPSRIRGRPYIKPAGFCFVDTEKFRPSSDKQNIIVFAGRLVEGKGPFFFLEAVRRLVNQNRSALSGWKVVMYGKGTLKNALLEYLKRMRLDSVIEISESGKLENVFSHTRLFVSAQPQENFTSLAMLEAMACGNAVIARNVGQTGEFVRHGKNGYLLSEDNPDDMARSIMLFIKNSHLHQDFAKASRDITTQYHNAVNFMNDIELFWRQVLYRQNKPRSHTNNRQNQ